MQDDFRIRNTRSVGVNYELKENYRVPIDRNPTLASGPLASDEAQPLSVRTVSDSPTYYYRYVRDDDGVWHEWTSGSVHDGELELI